MKNYKKSLIAAAILCSASGVQAEISGNAGITSDYVWRGVSQSADSASVSGGVDYASDDGMFYAGGWIGSLGEGAGSEVDLYLGLSGEVSALSYDIGYMYYLYPSIDDINFGEVYGSVGMGAFTLGVAYTIHNDSGNEGGSFASGDVYYYLSGETEVSDDWTLSATVAQYAFDNDNPLNELDYVHYQVALGTSTDMGDFTIALSDNDLPGDDVRAIVSWGISF